MSVPIRSHAGENKRLSNYSLWVRARWVQFVGDESSAGQDAEEKQEREGETRRMVYERNQ